MAGQGAMSRPGAVLGGGRVVRDREEDARPRRLPKERYGGAGRDLERWRRTALPVAVDLEVGERGGASAGASPPPAQAPGSLPC